MCPMPFLEGNLPSTYKQSHIYWNELWFEWQVYLSEGPTAKLDMDLTQFKQVLISAIEEDDKFAGMLFNVFQKKLIGSR